MYILPILFLVLFTSTEVSSKRKHYSADEDIFEDALLEHLRDVREEDDERNVYYDNEDQYDDRDRKRELSKDQLLEVLDVIKKEARRRRAKLKKSIETKSENKKRTEKHKDYEQKHSKKSHKSDTRTIDKSSVPIKKKDGEESIGIELEKKDKQSDGENSQVASVEVDNSVDKENELINKVNLRDILKAKDANENKVSTDGPSHAHIKQEKVVSTKSNKSGLDRVSFIAVVAGCCVAAIAGLALAAYCWYKLRVESKEDSENPKPPKKTPSLNKGKKDVQNEKPISKDEEMNVNAEYYNYQHAKNQIKQMGQSKPLSEKFAGDETTDDEDDEDTVYECPGLAAPGDMKVVNPMFSDGESRHSDKHSESTSHDGSPTPPNERMESVAQTNNNNNHMP